MLSGEKSFSAEYAMQQVMEFIPIPMVIEKLTPIPQAVPINSGGRLLFRQTQHLLAVECSNGNGKKGAKINFYKFVPVKKVSGAQATRF